MTGPATHVRFASGRASIRFPASHLAQVIRVPHQARQVKVQFRSASLRWRLRLVDAADAGDHVRDHESEIEQFTASPASATDFIPESKKVT
jgi:hypothetical protein